MPKSWPALLVLVLVSTAAGQGVRYYLFQEEVELSLLLRACGDQLGMPIDFLREDVSGMISIGAPDGLSFDNLWALTNRRLADRGLACIQPPGEEALSVVTMDRAFALSRIAEGEVWEEKAGFVKILYLVEHAEPRELETAVVAMLPEGGSVVTSFAASDHLLIAGPKPQVQEVLSILSMLDSGPEEVVVEEVLVQHVMATVLATQLLQLKEKRTSAGAKQFLGDAVANPSKGTVLLVAPQSEMETWRAWAKRIDQPDSILTRSFTPTRFGLSETGQLVEQLVTREGTKPPGWKMVTDELTGSLIISAPFSVLEKIEALFVRLEGSGVPRRALRSFSVTHRDVDELLDLLRGLLEGGVAIAEVLGRSEPTGEEGAVTPPGSVSQGTGALTISADRDTNRILAFGEIHLLTQLKGLIETLDVPHPQVLVEVLVVSLSESQMQDLGVELRYGASRGGRTGELASLFGLGGPLLSDSAVSSPGGSGATGVILNPGDFSFLVRALETVNDGRSLTIPKILVSNHQDATLNSVLQTPFISTAATNTVATTSLGGTSDAGTAVTVTPHILDGGRIRLSYDVSISTFVGDSTDPALPPPRQENLLSSTVTIPDGFAVAVGGLEVETKTEATTKVPFLGSLPIVGALFRSRSESTTKNRFFVFLRCSVFRGERFEALRHMSSKMQEAAGISAALPVMQPRIIR